MRPKVSELHKELGVKLNATVRCNLQLHHPSANPIGIELSVPGRVKGVGEEAGAAIAAEFDHLRTTIQCLIGAGRVRSTAHDSANVNRADWLGMERIRNVILAHLT